MAVRRRLIHTWLFEPICISATPWKHGLRACNFFEPWQMSLPPPITRIFLVGSFFCLTDGVVILSYNNPPQLLYCAQIAAAIFQARIHYLCPWFLLLLQPFHVFPTMTFSTWRKLTMALSQFRENIWCWHNTASRFQTVFCWSSGSSNQCVIEVVKVLEWLTVVWCAFWLSVVLPLFIYFVYLAPKLAIKLWNTLALLSLFQVPN